jgi:hypothetical protein
MVKRNRPRSDAEKQADKLRTGRPPVKPRVRKSARITIQLTPEERTKLMEMASAEGLSLAALIMRPWRKEQN